MNKNVEEKIANYEKAAEEVMIAIQVAVLERKIDLSVESGREMMDRLQVAQLFGARGERAILEGVALATAYDIVRKKFENKN
jgi:hypothetical protein